MEDPPLGFGIIYKYQWFEFETHSATVDYYDELELNYQGAGKSKRDKKGEGGGQPIVVASHKSASNSLLSVCEGRTASGNTVGLNKILIFDGKIDT